MYPSADETMEFLLSLIIFPIGIAFLFMTLGIRLQKHVIRKEIRELSALIASPLRAWGSEQIRNDLIAQLRAIPAPAGASAAKKRNEKLLKPIYLAMLIAVGVAFLLMLAGAVAGLNMLWILTRLVVLLAVIVVIEAIFYVWFAARYRPIDIQKVYAKIVRLIPTST
jgi:hypothetical protein